MVQHIAQKTYNFCQCFKCTLKSLALQSVLPPRMALAQNMQRKYSVPFKIKV